MKKYISILALLLLFAVFTACEKSELDGHAPMDNQNVESFSGSQSLRVNDDSDQEDSGPAKNKNLSANDNTDLTQNSTTNGVDVGNGVPSGEGNDNDGYVNDDSDDEEEGRRPNANNPHPKGAE